MNQSMGLNTNTLIKAALIAGVAIGLLSSAPLIACVNCLLLAWVWGGGIGAVALYRRFEHRPPLTITHGVILGAAAGVVGAIVGGVLAVLFGGMSAAVNQMLSTYAGEAGTTLPNFLFSAGFSVIGIFINIVLYAIVGAIGGIIATALIWKTPAGPIPTPPYTPPPSAPGM